MLGSQAVQFLRSPGANSIDSFGRCVYCSAGLFLGDFEELLVLSEPVLAEQFMCVPLHRARVEGREAKSNGEILGNGCAQISDPFLDKTRGEADLD
ncbi:hypothetical protein AC529_16710 [Thermobifida cellulosilytica TB100]|uniref:Uncharacterized protein n=1 Tax=Thermobifida cellulosilytica TB100 TaxID=665004 RepID=A0A147KE59_THECS|nr:hypothetical protein AC529_16710 [Thermobifida cellulosilytica TB100]